MRARQCRLPVRLRRTQFQWPLRVGRKPRRWNVPGVPANAAHGAAAAAAEAATRAAGAQHAQSSPASSALSPAAAAAVSQPAAAAHASAAVHRHGRLAVVLGLGPTDQVHVPQPVLQGPGRDEHIVRARATGAAAAAWERVRPPCV